MREPVFIKNLFRSQFVGYKAAVRIKVYEDISRCGTVVSGIANAPCVGIRYTTMICSSITRIPEAEDKVFRA